MTRPLLAIDPMNVAAHARMIGNTHVMSRRNAMMFYALRCRVLA
jgi:hypothetical protein